MQATAQVVAAAAAAAAAAARSDGKSSSGKSSSDASTSNGSGQDNPVTLEANARVEAVFKRDVGSGYYPGRLSVDNGDGTWAVDFDDGDRDACVPSALIRYAPQMLFRQRGPSPAAAAAATRAVWC